MTIFVVEAAVAECLQRKIISRTEGSPETFDPATALLSVDSMLAEMV
jgi:hypothetical protein